MAIGFTLLVIAVCAYALMVEGLFNAFLMLVNVLVAGLVTFNFWEPCAGYLEPMFYDSFLKGYEDAFCLTGIFWLTVLCMRVATTQFAPAEIDIHPVAQRAGGALFGAITGYLTAGFLLCLMQTLPWQVQFLSFDPEYKEQNVTRSYMPSDRVWLALMHRAGLYAFANDTETFDPHGTFELRYARYRRIDSSHPLQYYGEFDREVYPSGAEPAAGSVPPGLSSASSTSAAAAPTSAPKPAANDAGAKK